MQIDRLDHLVLTVRDLAIAIDFYTRVLGMEEVTFGNNRKALRFGQQRINLHQQGSALLPLPDHPTRGAGDLCFIAATPLDEVVSHLRQCSVEIVEGPTAKVGALGLLNSIYFRDPDGNLIEVSNYLTYY
jgi:catechol 2,3-dioxygenase-like lactoylglutathione lyase family enzyme